MEAKLDCGDNSCEFAENKTGMRTNGGCRCLKDLSFDRRMAVRGYIKALREENARLREYMRPDQIEEAETVTKLIRERDEARELIDVEKKQHLITKHCYDDMVDEVARLEGLILDWYINMGGTGSTWLAFVDEALRIRAQREEGR